MRNLLFKLFLLRSKFRSLALGYTVEDLNENEINAEDIRISVDTKVIDVLLTVRCEEVLGCLDIEVPVELCWWVGHRFQLVDQVVDVARVPEDILLVSAILPLNLRHQRVIMVDLLHVRIAYLFIKPQELLELGEIRELQTLDLTLQT